MATTFSVNIVKVWAIGDRKAVIADITATGVPTAAGDVLSPSALGLEVELNGVMPMGAARDAGQTVGAAIQWDPTDNKVSFIAAGAAATGGVVITGNMNQFGLFRVLAIGKGSAVVNA